MIKTLKELTKEYTKQDAGLRLAAGLGRRLDSQAADIIEWINLPWDGSIPIPGWQFNLQEFYEGKDNPEFSFLVVNMTAHKYYWPLLRLGCCAPVGLLRKGVAEVNTAHNRTIFRALVLNSFKLFVLSKHHDDRDHATAEICWTEFLEASGTIVAEEVGNVLRNLMVEGLITRPEDLATDIDHSEPDELNFPSSADGYMYNSKINPAIKNGYHLRDRFYQANEGTKAWVSQLVNFVKAKLSYVRTVKSNYVADAPDIPLGDFKHQYFAEGMARIAFQMCRWYSERTPEEQAQVLGKYPFLKPNCLAVPSSLTDVLVKNPVVWTQHCSTIKKNIFKNYYRDFTKTLDRIVDLCEKCKGNMLAGKSTRRSAHGIDTYSNPIAQHISGNTGCPATPQHIQVIKDVLGRYVPATVIKEYANLYELGFPETDEMANRIYNGDLKDFKFVLPDPMFKPSNCVATCTQYLDLIRDYNLWLYGNPDGSSGVLGDHHDH